jgi:hypothetical protein
VFRAARIFLKLEHIEESRELMVALKYCMETLKAQNSSFSRETFINYINQEGATL